MKTKRIEMENKSKKGIWYRKTSLKIWAPKGEWKL